MEYTCKHVLSLFIMCYLIGQPVVGLTSIFDASEDRSVQFFEEENQGGNETEPFYWHNPNLSGDWSSLEQNGIWVYYSEENYSGNNVTVVFGEDVAINVFHPLKSFRYAGNVQGTPLPAVILYQETWFRGLEYHVEADESDDLLMVPNFRDMGTKAQSMIIVGSPWTAFREQNFLGGDCTCLRPTHYDVSFGDDGQEMVMASFYPDLMGGDNPVGSVGSLMMTCIDVPMKKHCYKRPEEDVRRSQCPVLTNGPVQYCGLL